MSSPPFLMASGMRLERTTGPRRSSNGPNLKNSNRNTTKQCTDAPDRQLPAQRRDVDFADDAVDGVGRPNAHTLLDGVRRVVKFGDRPLHLLPTWGLTLALALSTRDTVP